MESPENDSLMSVLVCVLDGVSLGVPWNIHLLSEMNEAVTQLRRASCQNYSRQICEQVKTTKNAVAITKEYTYIGCLRLSLMGTNFFCFPPMARTLSFLTSSVGPWPWSEQPLKTLLSRSIQPFWAGVALSFLRNSQWRRWRLFWWELSRPWESGF